MASTRHLLWTRPTVLGHPLRANKSRSAYPPCSVTPDGAARTEHRERVLEARSCHASATTRGVCRACRRTAVVRGMNRVCTRAVTVYILWTAAGTVELSAPRLTGWGISQEASSHSPAIPRYRRGAPPGGARNASASRLRRKSHPFPEPYGTEVV